MADYNQQSLRLVLRLVTVYLAVMSVLPGATSQKARKGQAIGRPKDDGEIWLIGVGPIGSRENYLDTDLGQLKGYEIDILSSICEIAEKDCRIVEDIFSNCWDTVEGVGPVGGPGLYNFYYDACMGWNPTYTRARTFRFSKSFAQNRGSVFLVRSGNPGNFNWTDLTNKTIGLIDGFVSDDACILRAGDDIRGSELTDAQIIYYLDPDALVDGVRAGQVDAGFDTTIDYPEDIEVASDPVFCALGGNAMMTRKDSRFNDWFNLALDELVASEKYQEICDNLTEEHGHIPGPDAEDICI